jgi:sortase A
MTAVESAQQAESPGPAPAGAGAGAQAAAPATAAPGEPPTAAAAPGLSPADAAVRGLGIAVTLLAVLVLGFAGYLYYLSGVQEARAQTGMYATLRGELGQGNAPLNLPPPSTPVAVLNVPAIGLHNVVVVEGTSPENMTLGPGHLRDTPLPGEAGTSVIYGRRATFGAPFSRVPRLRPGDTITVTTGQGTARYVVKLVASSQNRILINPAPNQLMLITADSTLYPSHYIEVDANLTSSSQPVGARPAISPAEIALGNDPTALILCLAWGLALVAVSVGGTLAAIRWSKWPAYLVTIPIALAVVWNLYQSLAALLPNLY